MAHDKTDTQRKLTGAFFQSLDGVLQAPGGPEEDRSGDFRFGGWSAKYWDASMEGPAAKETKEPSEAELERRRKWAQE